MEPLPEDLTEIHGNGKKYEQPNLESFMNKLKKFNDQIQVVTKDEYPIYTVQALRGKLLKGDYRMSSGQFVLGMQIPRTGDNISQRLFPVFPKGIAVKFESGSI